MFSAVLDWKYLENPVETIVFSSAVLEILGNLVETMVFSVAGLEIPGKPGRNNGFQ